MLALDLLFLMFLLPSTAPAGPSTGESIGLVGNAGVFGNSFGTRFNAAPSRVIMAIHVLHILGSYSVLRTNFFAAVAFLFCAEAELMPPHEDISRHHMYIAALKAYVVQSFEVPLLRDVAISFSCWGPSEERSLAPTTRQASRDAQGTSFCTTLFLPDKINHR
jgi:hypothetical protein